ncbi:MAG: M48 family metallopeptidase [Candidatus Kapaibacterium sp.]
MKKILNFSGRLLIILMIGMIAPAFQSCEDPLSVNIFPVSRDVELGKELDRQIRSNPSEFPILNNKTITQYLQNMVDSIVLSPMIDYRNRFAYTVTVIDDDETVNAFAAPGGYLYVYTGLMKFLDNEATMAGILAHEVAHAELRHATQRITKAYGAQFLANLLLGDDPSQLETVVGEILTNLALLKNSRDDEYEADEYSFNYLQSTRWYPGGIIFFFEKVDQDRDAGFLQELLSTHPLPQDRMQKMEQMINNAGLPDPDEGNLFTQRYIQYRSMLP